WLLTLCLSTPGPDVIAGAIYTQPGAAAAQAEMAMSQEQPGSQPGVEHLYEQLRAKANSQGSVRVIVQLRLDTRVPEGQLPNPQAIAAQRDAIAQLQTRLLQRLASVAVANVRQFQSVPQMALEVDAAGMQALLSHPDVVSIWEDAVVPPTR